MTYNEIFKEWENFISSDEQKTNSIIIFEKIESTEFFQNNPNQFFKDFIIKPIEKDLNKKYIKNREVLKLSLGFFLDKCNEFSLDEKSSESWLKILSSNKFNFLNKPFFSKLLNNMSLDNEFKFYNYESFSNITYLKKFYTAIIQFLENDQIN